MQPFNTLQSYNCGKHFYLARSFRNKLTELWLSEFLNYLKAEYDKLQVKKWNIFMMLVLLAVGKTGFLGMTTEKERFCVCLSLFIFKPKIQSKIKCKSE